MRKLILAVLLLGTSCLAMGEENSGAREPVIKLDNALISAMKNAKSLGYEGRQKALSPVVLETHDFEAISKLAIGMTRWKALSDPEKAELVKKLTEYSIATYAAQFDSYAGEEFKFDSEEAKGKFVTVRYNLTAPGEPVHKFEYVMNKAGDQWRIINIVVDGISDLATKRAQYEHIIEAEGFGKLLEKLSEKIADYAKSRAHPS
ncbi:ABC transporter substrate-binding protein [Methylogaea oryzae]|uniref:Hopanoid biosynthesis protein HpnM n=1 Tax=Methylogaea oryzae TaxID=1295382 RepID=A0A8D4VTT2_9GAMM|nr:ABC transporter substrate-binding protein [Methylogaea oryzae]BBL72175.1 hypothetical protein MoryE10_27810 [Methylogaea oryzae]